MLCILDQSFARIKDTYVHEHCRSGLWIYIVLPRCDVLEHKRTRTAPQWKHRESNQDTVHIPGEPGNPGVKMYLLHLLIIGSLLPLIAATVLGHASNCHTDNMMVRKEWYVPPELHAPIRGSWEPGIRQSLAALLSFMNCDIRLSSCHASLSLTRCPRASTAYNVLQEFAQQAPAQGLYGRCYMPAGSPIHLGR